MNAREAAIAAKQHVLDMFGGENIHSVGLEEIRCEKGSAAGWSVTIGFARDWRPDGSLMRTLSPASRVYKIVKLDAADGSLKSITHREIPSEQTA